MVASDRPVHSTIRVRVRVRVRVQVRVRVEWSDGPVYNTGFASVQKQERMEDLLRSGSGLGLGLECMDHLSSLDTVKPWGSGLF